MRAYLCSLRSVRMCFTMRRRFPCAHRVGVFAQLCSFKFAVPSAFRVMCLKSGDCFATRDISGQGGLWGVTDKLLQPGC